VEQTGEGCGSKSCQGSNIENAVTFIAALIMHFNKLLRQFICGFKFEHPWLVGCSVGCESLAVFLLEENLPSDSKFGSQLFELSKGIPEGHLLQFYILLELC
jgi:predicted alpha/beta-fold hydrolase